MCECVILFGVCGRISGIKGDLAGRVDSLLAAVRVAYEFKKEKEWVGEWGVGMHAGDLTWNAFY